MGAAGDAAAAFRDASMFGDIAILEAGLAGAGRRLCRGDRSHGLRTMYRRRRRRWLRRSRLCNRYTLRVGSENWAHFHRHFDAPLFTSCVLVWRKLLQDFRKRQYDRDIIMAGERGKVFRRALAQFSRGHYDLAELKLRTNLLHRNGHELFRIGRDFVAHGFGQGRGDCGKRDANMRSIRHACIDGSGGRSLGE